MPERGEWIDLHAPELAEPAQNELSELPIARDVEWSASSRERWGVWCRDPVAAYWTVGDVLLAVDTLRIFHDHEQGGSLPLTEIALTTGFGDQSHFSRRFHELVGVPPGVFRGHAGGLQR